MTSARIRIGIDATPLLGQRAGVGQYTGRLLSALLQTQPEREYLLYAHRALAPLESELSGAVPVTSHLPIGRWNRWLWMQVALPRIIQRTQPALCHFTNELAPFFHIKPTVVTIHDASLFLHARHHPLTRLLTRLAFVPLVAHQASMVITVSESARRDLIRILRLPPEKVCVVYEAAPAHFRPLSDPKCRAALRAQYSLPESYILYVGAFEPRKNLPRLLRAFARARRAGGVQQLVMVGPNGWHMDGFAQTVEALGLRDAIIRLAYVPDADLAGIYSLATFFVYPSLYEGFGLPPLEAMACGTPVITSNNSSLAELYCGAAYLVDALDEDRLAEALHELSGNADLRADLSARGLERAQSFSWERAAAETTAIYDRLLANRSNGSHPS